MLEKCIKSAVEVQLKCIDDMTENRKIQNLVIRIGWLFVAGDGPFRKGPIMTENEHFTGIKTTEQPRERDWLALLVAFAIILLTVSVGCIGWYAIDAIRENTLSTKSLQDRIVSQGLAMNEALKKIEGRPPVVGGTTPADYSDRSPDLPQSGTSDSIEDAFPGSRSQELLPSRQP